MNISQKNLEVIKRFMTNRLNENTRKFLLKEAENLKDEKGLTDFIVFTLQFLDGKENELTKIYINNIDDAVHSLIDSGNWVHLVNVVSDLNSYLLEEFKKDKLLEKMKESFALNIEFSKLPLKDKKNIMEHYNKERSE